MSFDISVHRIVDGKSPPCNPKEAQACIDLLANITSGQADDFNFLYLEFEDGSGTEVSIWEDPNNITHATFFTRGLSASILGFIYDLAVAGNMMILNMQGSDSSEHPIAIAPNETIKSLIGEAGFEHIVVCSGPEELAKFLGASFSDWSNFRDKALNVAKPHKRSWFSRILGRK